MTKLRFVEREIYTPVQHISPDVMQRRVVKILQYCESDKYDDGTEFLIGNWVDVPLEVEETT